MKTVFVLVDALKSLYLTKENMPFLFSLSGNGFYIRQIFPSAGFCERSEIFSGLDGFDTGNFTAIGYNQEFSPYKNDGALLFFAELLEKLNKRVARKMFSLWRIKNKKSLNPYRIPFKSLKYFALTEDGEINLRPHKQIFDELAESNLTYTLEGFTSLSDLHRRTSLRPVDLVKKEICANTDFIPLYIGTIDSAGHRYGNNLESIRPFLLEVDNQLKQIYEESIQSNYAFCVLGDHGMVPISNKVNLIKEIEATGLCLHKDYESFYDSTIARFWFRNAYAKKRIHDFLENCFSDYGFMVDESNYLKYRIPLDIKTHSNIPVYGDLLWCANPGVLISPDYFHSEDASERGMHGYIETVEGHGTGLYIEMYNGVFKETLDKAKSASICGRLCKLLNIQEPNNKKEYILW